VLHWLWLIPALPFAGFVLLFVTGGRLPARATAAIGAGSTGIAAALALAIAHSFLTHSFLRSSPATAYGEVLWRWVGVGRLDIAVGLRLDALSLIMMLVVTFVGFLIHLYSTEFMSGDEGYGRFFCYLNLFVAAMLLLVLADNLLLLYAGWEGVGLCSYLLIGFWYRDPDNGRAARKAFIVTRLGDVAFLVGLLLLFSQLGTLAIAPLLSQATRAWPAGSTLPTVAASLLLGGAIGKSAQFPLQVWLPDAMAGPTPVSALIHAATMVTAGVYLIARMHALYELAPAVRLAVAAIGATTLLLSAAAALNQHDFKRILAYSTISQIGYMFLGLGVGAWTAAIFHLMTHAFFKALLFLAAGAVMMRTGNEHDIFRLGGLRRSLPLAFWTFLAGAASLAALPIVTAGFFSKDMILWGVWSAGGGALRILWAAGVVGAFLTAVYIFRAVFVVFFGETRIRPSGRYGLAVAIPLVTLAVLALIAGWLDTPAGLGHVTVFSRFLGPTLPPQQEVTAAPQMQWLAMGVTSGCVLLGVAVAWLVYGRRPIAARGALQGPVMGAVSRLLRAGWGFDALYDYALVRPFLWITRINRNDFIDAIYGGVTALAQAGHAVLSRSETGRMRWYAGWIAAGSLAALAVALFL
jgi:NADH-quinone oxidoreductase subunit L